MSNKEESISAFVRNGRKKIVKKEVNDLINSRTMYSRRGWNAAQVVRPTTMTSKTLPRRKISSGRSGGMEKRAEWTRKCSHPAKARRNAPETMKKAMMSAIKRE